MYTLGCGWIVLGADGTKHRYPGDLALRLKVPAIQTYVLPPA